MTCFSRLLLILSLAFAPLFALEPNKYIAFPNTEGLPAAVACGCVNTITGDYVEVNTDLIVKAPHPLMFERSYVSSAHEHGSLMSGWRHNYGSLLARVKHYGQPCSCYLSSYGSVTVSSGEEFRHTLDLSLNGAGLTNCAREIGAATNLKNLVTVIDPKDNCSVTTGGNHRIFFPFSTLPIPISVDYEKFPDELTLSYHYDLPGTHYKNGNIVNSLNKVCLKDSEKKEEFASISIKHVDDSQWQLTGSNGEKVTYFFQLFKVTKKQRDLGLHNHHYLNKVIRADGGIETFQYVQRTGEGAKYNAQFLSRKQLPDNRFIEISYYGANLARGDFRIDRVKEIREPIGTDARAILSGYFNYQMLEEGTLRTDHFNAYNHRTSYYSKNSRLTAIELFSDKGTHSVERFYWGADNSPLSTQLLSHTLEDQTGKIEWCRCYQYDSRGNILVERFYANLTGACHKPIILENGYPIDNGAEYQETCYTYSDDGYNHRLSEESGQKKTSYTYDSITHHPSAIFTWGNGRIQKRRFLKYNAKRQVILEIQDDGSSPQGEDLTDVTQQHIKKISYTGNHPTQEERYALDLNTLQPLLECRLVNTYSRDHLIQQEHYDAQNQYTHTLYWEYDAQGNIVKETDPYGYTIERKYDLNHNLVFHKNKRGTRTQYTYSFANRLIKEQQTDIDGTMLVTSHRYDLLGNRIATVDPYGQQTHYTHDHFGNVLTKTMPSIPDAQGNLIPCIERYTYSLHNHPASFTDSLGHTVHTETNVRGKPTHIIYPDGSTESYTYDQTGHYPTSYTMKNGTHITYTYDYQDRIIQQSTYDNHALLKTEKYQYNAFHLLSHTDPAGIITAYTYNSFGQLSSATTDDRTTHYRYDNRGKLYQQITPNTLITTQYDLLERLIEKRIADPNGNTYISEQYRYDTQNNLTHTIQGQAITITQYNAQGKPITHIDPLGNTTHITYNYKHLNPQHQQVLQKIETDPLGQQRITTYDTHQYPTVIEIYSPYGHLLSKTAHSYDTAHNLIQTSRDNLITTREYNSLGQLVHLSEANQKHTYHTYHQGQKTSTVKPDGVRILYTYDPLGRLHTLHSSDNTISYQYTYNSHDLTTHVQDHITHTATQRSYNSHQQLIHETLANDLTLDYRYNEEGKLTTIILPDQTAIHYTHSPTALTEVTYKQITHTYVYNEQNHIIQSGDTRYTRDLLGRPTNISAPHYTQDNLTYDPAGNLLSYQLNDTPHSFTYDHLYQLATENNHTYSHDSQHNRTSKDDIPYTYNTLNQLLTQGSHTYTYDPNGNLLTTPTTTYTYDALNRPMTYTKDNTTHTYTYDPFNRRLTKDNMHYLYAFQNEIGAYQDNELTQLRILGQGLSAEIGAAVALYLNNQWYTPIHDHQGNTTLLLDQEHNPIESYSYTSFGEEDNHPSINPWRFASKRHDPDTHTIAFGHRDYDPAIGRWLTPDPIPLLNDPNLYAFVKNNPHHYIDPDGRVIALAVPLICLAFGVETTVVYATAAALATAAVCYAIDRGAFENLRLRSILEKGAPLLHQLTKAVWKENTEEAKEGEEEKKKEKTPPRTEPKNLEEQLALQEAKNGKGDTVKMEIKDPRYPPDTWQKKQHQHSNPDGTKTNIHYWENIKTGERHGFKFKDKDN